MSLGQTGTYVPTEGQIEKTTPKQGLFFRPQTAMTVASISRAAYGKDYTANGVKAIAASAWNHHIRYTEKGYEYLKIKGPAMHKLYAMDPLSKYGSGKNYPVFWIPPLATKAEPEQVFTGDGETDADIAATIRAEVERYLRLHPPAAGAAGKTGAAGKPGAAGAQGATGPAGPQGPPGAQGQPGPAGSGISAKEIAQAVSDYIEKNPIAGVTPEQIAREVAAYLKAHPPAGVPVEEIQKQVAAWLEIHPPAGVTPELIAREVAAYLRENPVEGTPGPRGAQGVIGPPGPQGPAGLPGQASEEMIGKLIKAYLETHPLTGEVSPEQLAAAIRKYMEMHPVEIPTNGKPSTAPAWGVLAFLAKVSAGI